MALTNSMNASTQPPASTKHTFIVEHLDPELDSWQESEYSSIYRESTAAGIKFQLTGVKQQDLTRNLRDNHAMPATAFTSEKVERIYGAEGVKQRTCLLDPKAEAMLGPDDAEKFDVFVFGGILGDDPPRDRTGELRKLGFAGRTLGPEQMTTDTAARVTRIIIQEQKRMDQIEFINEPDFTTPYIDEDGNVDPKRAHEVVSMPFKYIKGADGLPVIPDGMLELLAKDADKGIMDLL